VGGRLGRHARKHGDKQLLVVGNRRICRGAIVVRKNANACARIKSMSLPSLAKCETRSAVESICVA